jgi:hypothetical protein
MNMQAFYKRLSVKPTRAHQRRLVNLTRLTRSQILDAIPEDPWLIWSAEKPNV